MERFNYNKFKKLYFSGICGVSMSAIAKHLALKGKIIGGSDLSFGKTARELNALGITVFMGNRACHVKEFNPDILVYSSAIDINGEEIQYARERQIPVIRRSVLLNSIMQEYVKSIAVSGCHGKTTTTAMISKIMEQANLSPTVFLGSDEGVFSNYRQGNGESIIVEACEYDKNISFLKPNISIVLNVDNDHLDSYESLEELTQTYEKFIKNTLAFVNSDDKRCVRISTPSTVTFGIDNLATYRAVNLKQKDGFYSFTVLRNNIKQREIKLKVMGRHNVYNAIASYSLCDNLGIPSSLIKTALENFQGVGRRMEYLGNKREVGFYADYAHHPTEIQATLEVLQNSNERWLVVFQPHTYSRTRILLGDFIRVLKNVQDLILYKTYPAREKYDKEGSSYCLYTQIQENGGKGVKHASNIILLKKFVNESLSKVDKVIFIGAGDIYDLAKKILEKN